MVLGEVLIIKIWCEKEEKVQCKEKSIKLYELNRAMNIFNAGFSALRVGNSIFSRNFQPLC